MSTLTFSLDGKWGHWCLGPPQIHSEMVLLTPCHKVSHHSPVLSLLALVDTSNYNRVIRKLFKMAELCVVVRGVEGEEEGKQVLLITLITLSDTQWGMHTCCGLPVTSQTIQETKRASTCIIVSFSPSRAGRMALNTR